MLSRLRTSSLEELATQFDWSDAASSFLTPRATFQTVLQSLINHGYWFDGANLLSHALPQREAVWWSTVVCKAYVARVGVEGPEKESQETLLALAREWVTEPTEESRMAVYQAGQQVANRLPAHWVGMAVFWSMGNITPDAGVVTPPPPYLYARGVSAAIDLAASLTIAEREPFYAEALGRGVHVASGGDGDSVLTLQKAR